MDTNRRASRRSGLARFIVAASLVTLGMSRAAHADSHLVIALVPKHVFSARGFSVRDGDYFVLEPSFLFVGDAKPGSRPIVGVVRPMVGVGGSGLGVGFAYQPFFGPIAGGCDQDIEDYVAILPISVEAHVERMYGPTEWRSATYLGPQLSLSIYVLKVSVGVMTNVGDQRDRRGQLGIGGGF